MPLRRGRQSATPMMQPNPGAASGGRRHSKRRTYVSRTRHVHGMKPVRRHCWLFWQGEPEREGRCSMSPERLETFTDRREALALFDLGPRP